MLVAMMAQGRGHKLEKTALVPFRELGDLLARFFVEQCSPRICASHVCFWGSGTRPRGRRGRAGEGVAAVALGMPNLGKRARSGYWSRMRAVLSGALATALISGCSSAQTRAPARTHATVRVPCAGELPDDELEVVRAAVDADARTGF
jgi:hypothetical protein